MPVFRQGPRRALVLGAGPLGLLATMALRTRGLDVVTYALAPKPNPNAALAAYRRSMERYPRRFNGLLGSARAARALGDESLARAFYRELLEVADGGTRQPALREAQHYTAQRR